MHIYLETIGLLQETQSGFRKHHSCQTALKNIVDSWLKCIEGNLIGSVFIYLKKAFEDSNVFDTVRATLRDNFVRHGHVNYTKHKSNIYKAMLMHIFLMNFKSCSYFNICSDNVC